MRIEEIPDEPIENTMTDQPQPRHRAKKNIDIDKQEQQRIIQESGIFEKMATHSRIDSGAGDDEDEPKFFQAIFLTAMLLIIFIILQVAVFANFQEPIALSLDNSQLQTLLSRVAGLAPALLFIVYITHKYCTHPITQLLLFVASVGLGLLFPRGDHASYGDHMKSPGMGTLWAYTLIQLNLPLATLSLVMVFGWYYWQSLTPEQSPLTM